MVYLQSFRLPSRKQEEAFLDPSYAALVGKRAGGSKIQMNVGASYYPFRVFQDRQTPTFTFEEITIFYGGNGSGKSTLLNLIAEKLSLNRDSVYNRSEFFSDYVELCEYGGREIPEDSRIITSDDVFNFLLDVRFINNGAESHRERLYEEYATEKARIKSGERVQMRTLADYEVLKKRVEVNRKSMSQYTRERAGEELRERSNGESAFRYFTEAIREDRLILLDEPENSMSPAMQREMLEFLTESARFFHCQLILATHSPFFLSMKGARIYDLDATPPAVRPWTELENVREYYRFFKEHEREF